jgi:hypothetical protein
MNDRTPQPDRDAARYSGHRHQPPRLPAGRTAMPATPVPSASIRVHLWFNDLSRRAGTGPAPITAMPAIAAIQP